MCRLAVGNVSRMASRKNFQFFSIQAGVFSEKNRRDSMEREKTRFFYDMVVGFAEFFRRDSMGREKNATFFGNLYRISVFLLIYPMCEIGRERRMTRKSGDFF